MSDARPACLTSEWTVPALYLSGGGPVSTHATTDRDSRSRSSSSSGPSHRATPGLLARSRTLTIASVVSRLTGFLRILALAATLGVAANGVADPYNAANSFPTMLYELLLGGVLSGVLVPFIVRGQLRDGDGGEAHTQRLLSIATASLGAATLLAVLAAPVLAAVFVTDPAERHLTSVLAALLLPEIFFYGLGAMCAAVLNTRNVYAAPAWAPVLNNLIVLATLGTFVLLSGRHAAPTVTSVSTAQILVLGLGTTCGIVAQALCLLPPLRRSGFRWRWRFRSSPGRSAPTGQLRATILWVGLYVLASQLGVAVITRIALSHGALSTFTYAALLFQAPYGVLGVSVLTAIMPRMSRAAARGQTEQLIADLRLAARATAVALVPITAGLIALAPNLTTAIFVGYTTPTQARLIGTVAAIAAFGLVPFTLVMLQSRVFYALGDARTPTVINGCMVAVEVGLVVAAAVLLRGDRVVEALGAATSASYVLGAALGHILLRRQLGVLGFTDVIRTAIRIAVPSAGAAGIAYTLARAVTLVLGDGRAAAAAGLLAGGLCGSAALWLSLRLTRTSEVRDIVSLMRA